MSKAKDIAIVSAPAVTAEELLKRDLTVDPPGGLPTLTPLQAKVVKLRILQPTASWESIEREAGSSTRAMVRRSAKVKQYVSALAAGTYEEDRIAGMDPSAQRREVLRTMALDAVTAATARERTFAGKCWLDQVKIEDDREPELRELTDGQLVERLEMAAIAIGDHQRALAPFANLDLSTLCASMRFPSPGNSVDGGRLAGQIAEGGRGSKTPESQ